MIREEKLSVALFAPGWVMETQGTKNFTSNQDKYGLHAIVMLCYTFKPKNLCCV